MALLAGICALCGEVGLSPMDLLLEGINVFFGGCFGFSSAVPGWTCANESAITCRGLGPHHPPTEDA